MSAHLTRRCRSVHRELTTLERQFERLIPHDLRHLSSTHWTPVELAVRAATLLCPTSRTRVLDIGSGIGKMCSIGALSTAGTWVGVEQHEPLVSTARRLARTLGVAERTCFLHADVFALDWNEYDALYLYNPFELTLFGERTSSRHWADQVAGVQERLAVLPSSTRVVTLHGFGGVMPETFELIYLEHDRPSGLDLALWIQRTHRTTSCVVS